MNFQDSSDDFNFSSSDNGISMPSRHIEPVKHYCSKIIQFLHFVMVMVYLWAGLVEFIQSPSYFDGYGDAAVHNKLPSQLLKDSPWNNQTSTLRLMDLPLLGILTGYAGVSFWLKFQGLSWLLTLCITIVFVEFLTVNYWAKEHFDWRYYHSRLTGLELQISSLAFAVTMILMVLFYKRRRLPFKFKSSLPVKHLGILHMAFNFVCILLITFTCMLLWFTKMYISWACFKTHDDIMQVCQVTSQVQCYPCNECTHEGMTQCYTDSKDKQYSCNTRFPEGEGAFCLFNFNMSSLKFLTIFAYIGGLCVFLSTLLRIFGHYSLRLLFKIYEHVLACFNTSSESIRRHQERVSIRRMLRQKTREQLLSGGDTGRVDGGGEILGDMEDTNLGPSISEIFEGYDDDNGGFWDASCG